MSQIDVKTKKLKKEVNELDQLSSELRGIISDIESCRNRVDTQSLATAINALRKISEGVNVQKDTVNSMKRALQDIMHLYEETEKKITEEGRKAYKEADGDSMLSDLLNKLKEMLSNLGNNGGGKQEQGAFDGDPVNVCTGNYFLVKDEIKINGLYPIHFALYFNGAQPVFTNVGTGWTHSYLNWLRTEGDSIVIHRGDGKEESFRQCGQDCYESIYGNDNKLIKNEQGYVITANDGKSMQYNEQGMLVQEQDKYGNYVAYSYEEGLLVKVENNSSASLSFEYDKKGHLIHVTDHTGRRVSLEYKNEDLVAVTGVDGAKTLFAYNPQHELIKIVNALGTKVLVNEYDDQRRVVRQSFPDDGVMTYEYPDSERVVYTDPMGNQKTYFHDEKWRHVATEQENGQEKREYDALNHCTMYEDFAGNQTHYSYDVRGNVMTVRDGYGAETSLEYDENNRLTKSKRPNGQTAYYDYNELGHPVKMLDPEGNVEEYQYDEHGNVIAIEKADGFTFRLDYDDRGNAIHVSDDNAKLLTYEYDELNRVTKVTDTDGYTTTYKYDLKDRVVQIQNVMGDICTFEYDKLGKLVRKTDFDQNIEVWNYNELGLVSAYKNKEDVWTKFAYNANWRLERVQEANGAVTEISYNAGNKIEQISHPGRGVISYKYDELMNCTEMSLNDEILAGYQYDANGHCTQVRNKDGDTYYMQYDESGRMVKMKDPSGKEVRFEYDMCDRIRRQIDSVGREKKFEYNETGKVIAVKDDLGQDFTCEYYPGGKLRQIAYANGLKEFYKYDAKGNVIERSNNLGYVVTFVYDALNRIVDQKSNLGERKAMKYDAMGQITEVTDAKGNVTKFEYNRQGKVTKVTDVDGIETEYKHDEMDQLIAFNKSHQGKDFATVYERNLFGDVSKITDALGNSSVFEYDAYGKVEKKTDEDGFDTHYYYNNDKIVKEIVYSDGRKASFEYDEMKRMISVTDWLGKTAFSYDEIGNIDKITNYDGKEITYERDENGNCTSVSYPNGQEVTYEYNDKKQLIRLQNGPDSILYNYNENGTIKEKIYSNGICESYAVNGKGLMKEHRISKNGEMLDSMSYEYDVMGSMISMERKRSGDEENSGSYRYEYNAANQLTKVFRNGECERAYTFDTFGNRLTKDTKTEHIEYQYNSRNQLIAETIVSEGETIIKTYDYDKRGNQIRQTVNGEQILLMEYDSQNRLAKMTDKEGAVTEYVYNALGYRVEKTSAKGKISYFSDYTKYADNLMMSSDEEGDKIYLWAYDVAGARTNDSLDFYSSDEFGTVIRSYHGEETKAYTYDEFGAPLADAWNGDCQIGFAGYQKEDIEGFYFANARYYMAEHGRYVAADIVKGMVLYPISLNEYAYCMNNPKKYVDKDGRAWHIVIGAVAGAVVNAGFEIYDQVKSGEFDITSGKSWGKIGTEALSGAISGGCTAAFGPAGGAIATGICDASAGIVKDRIDGEEWSVGMVTKNVIKGAISGGLSYVIGESGLTEKLDDWVTNKVKNITKKLPAGISNYFDDLMPIGDYGKNGKDVDILIDYILKGDKDKWIAAKWAGRYVEKVIGGGIVETILKNTYINRKEKLFCLLFY